MNIIFGPEEAEKEAIKQSQFGDSVLPGEAGMEDEEIIEDSMIEQGADTKINPNRTQFGFHIEKM